MPSPSQPDASSILAEVARALAAGAEAAQAHNGSDAPTPDLVEQVTRAISRAAAAAAGSIGDTAAMDIALAAAVVGPAPATMASVTVADLQLSARVARSVLVSCGAEHTRAESPGALPGDVCGGAA